MARTASIQLKGNLRPEQTLTYVHVPFDVPSGVQQIDVHYTYSDAESGSVESGVFTAQERITEALERDYRQKMPFKLVDEVLRTGKFRASGGRIDYRDAFEEALAPLRSETLNLLSEKW